MVDQKQKKWQSLQILLTVFLLNIEITRSDIILINNEQDNKEICPINFYSYQVSQSSYSCKQCQDNCSICSNSTCLLCKIGNNLDGSCLTKKEDCSGSSYFESSSNQCINCQIQFCAKCLSFSECLTCQNQFSLTSDNQCVYTQIFNGNKQNYLGQVLSYDQQNQYNLSYSCNFNEYSDDSRYACLQQQQCSFKQYDPYPKYTGNIRGVIQFQNNLIVIGSQQVFVYEDKADNNELQVKFTLANLIGKGSDYLRNGFMIKNNLILFSSLNVYIYSVEQQRLVNQLPFNQTILESFRNDNYYWYDISKQRIYYLSLDISYQILTLSIFKVTDNTSSVDIYNFSIELLDSQIIYQDENQINQYGFFFEVGHIFISNKRSIIDLSLKEIIESESQKIEILKYKIPKQDILFDEIEYSQQDDIFYKNSENAIIILRKQNMNLYLIKLTKNIINQMYELFSQPQQIKSTSQVVGFLQHYKEFIYIIIISNDKTQITDTDYYLFKLSPSLYNKSFQVQGISGSIKTIYKIIQLESQNKNILVLMQQSTIFFLNFQDVNSSQIQQIQLFSQQSNSFFFLSNQTFNLYVILDMQINLIPLNEYPKQISRLSQNQQKQFSSKTDLFTSDKTVTNFDAVEDSQNGYAFIITQLSSQSIYDIQQLDYRNGNILVAYRFFYFKSSATFLRQSCFVDSENKKIIVTLSDQILSHDYYTLKATDMTYYEKKTIVFLERNLFYFIIGVQQDTSEYRGYIYKYSKGELIKYFQSYIYEINPNQNPWTGGYDNNYKFIVNPYNKDMYGIVWYQSESYDYNLRLFIKDQDLSFSITKRYLYSFNFISDDVFIYFSQEEEKSNLILHKITYQGVDDFIYEPENELGFGYSSIFDMRFISNYNILVFFSETGIISSNSMQNIKLNFFDLVSNQFTELIPFEGDPFTYYYFQYDSMNYLEEKQQIILSYKYKRNGLNDFQIRKIVVEIKGLGSYLVKDTIEYGSTTNCKINNYQSQYQNCLGETNPSFILMPNTFHQLFFYFPLINVNMKLEMRYLTNSNRLFYQNDGQIFSLQNIPSNNLISFGGLKGVLQSFPSFALNILIIVENSDIDQQVIINIYTLDLLKFQVKIPNEYKVEDKIVWNEKFQKLIILTGNPTMVYIYSSSNQFQNYIYSRKLSDKRLFCSFLQYNPLMACTGYGIYNFQLNEVYENQYIYQKFNLEPFFYENTRYLYLGELKNFIGFDMLTTKYFNPDQLDNSFKLLFTPRFILFPTKGMEFQGVIQLTFLQTKCYIVELPSLKLIKEISSTIINHFECFFAEPSPYLFIRSSQSILGYKLPYKDRLELIYTTSLFQVNNQNSKVFGSNYIQLTYQEQVEGDPFLIITNINLSNGQIKTIKAGPGKSPKTAQKIIDYIQDKDLIITDQQVISLSDGQIMLSFEPREGFIRGIQKQFNFLLLNQQNSFGTLDISQMFPSVPNIYQIKNQFKVDIQNYYDPTDGTITFMNYEYMTIQQQTSDHIKNTVFQIQKAFSDQQSFTSLNTHHEIYQLDKKNNVFALFYQCNLIIFAQQIIYQQILQSEYNCQIHVILNNIYYYNYQTNELFTMIKKQNGQYESKIVYKTIQQISSIIKVEGCKESYLVLSFSNLSNFVMIKINDNSIIEIDNTKIIYDVTQIKSFDKEGTCYFVFGTKQGNVIIYKTENHKDFISDGSLQIQYEVMNLDITLIESNIFIYLTTQNRLHLILQTKDDQGKVTSYKNVISQLLYTTSSCQLKILSQNQISVYSFNQVALYSNALKFTGFIYESSFAQISNLFFVENMSTIILQDSNGIYIFNPQILLSDKRLKLIKTFSNLIVPQIMKIKQQQNQNTELTIIGTDTLHVFEIIYQRTSQALQTLVDLFNKDSILNDCTFSLKEYKYVWEQKLQFLDLISTRSEQFIKLSMTISQNRDLFLPTSLELNDIQAKKKIYLDINIQNYQISLLQNPNINLVNLELLKIQNGKIILNQKYYLQDMKLFQLKNIKLVISSKAQIHLDNVDKILLENIEFEFNSSEGDVSLKPIFVFENSGIIILDTLTFDNVKVQQKIFSVQNCSNIVFKDVTIQNSSKLESILIKAKNIQQMISINTLNVQKSTVNVLFKFTKVNNIKIDNIFIKESNQTSQIQNENRLLQVDDIDDYNSLFQIFYALGKVLINKVEINSCKQIQSFLSYNNTYSSELSQDSASNVITSKNSILQITDLQVISSKFFNQFINVQESTIFFKLFKISRSINILINVQKATKIVEFKQFEFIKNQQDLYSLVQIDSSQFYINDFTLKDNFGSQKNKLNCIQIYSSNFVIIKLKATNNNLGDYFLKIIRISSTRLNTKEQQIDNNYINFEFNSFYQILIKDQNDGALSIENMSLVKIFQSEITQNYCLGNGAGINLKNTSCQLSKTNIIQNQAEMYGGGVYLDNSDISLSNSLISQNTAQIGGGIRYINKLYPSFFNQDLNQIQNNTAFFFGNNYGSFPTEIRVKTALNDVVSSYNQQKTIILFELYGEDSEKVRFEHQPNLFQFNEILIERIKRKDEIMLSRQKVYEELQNYQSFIIQSTDDDVFIQKDTEDSIYNSTSNQFYFSTYLTNEGYELLLQYKNQSKHLPAHNLKIRSKLQFWLPSQGKMEQKLLTQDIPIQFRYCKKGEVIKPINKDGNQYYECVECEENSYSLIDPYLNNLQNRCKPCPKGSKICKGNEIIPIEDYWRDGETEFLAYCENAPSKCTQIDTLNGCSEGGIGPLCESCDYNNLIWKDSFYGKKNRYECSICGSIYFSLNQYLFPVVLGIIFFLYILYQIVDNQKEKIMKLKAIYLKRAEIINVSSSLSEVENISVIIKILISYFQIISIVSNFNIRIPDEIKKMAFYFGNTLETTYYSLDCLFIKLGFVQSVKMVYLRLLWSIILPVIYLISLGIVFLYLRKTKHIKRQRNILISGILQFYYMFYTSIIQQTFGTLSCRVINNVSYVLLDVQYECYDTDYFLFNFLITLPMVILIMIPPIILKRIMKKNKHNLLKIDVFLNYGFFYSEYKQKYYYWEIIKIWQKIVVFIIINAFNQSNIISSLIISITIILYKRYQLINKPFQKLEFNQLDHQAQTTAIFTIFFLLMNTNTSSGAIQIIAVILIIIFNIFFYLRVIKLIVMHFILYHEHKFIRKLVQMTEKFLQKSLNLKAMQERNFAKMNKNWQLLKYLIRSKKVVSHYYDSQQKGIYQTNQGTTIQIDPNNSFKSNQNKQEMAKQSQQIINNQSKYYSASIKQSQEEQRGFKEEYLEIGTSQTQFKFNQNLDDRNKNQTQLSESQSIDLNMTFYSKDGEDNKNGLDFQKNVIRAQNIIKK